MIQTILKKLKVRILKTWSLPLLTRSKMKLMKEILPLFTIPLPYKSLSKQTKSPSIYLKASKKIKHLRSMNQAKESKKQKSRPLRRQVITSTQVCPLLQSHLKRNLKNQLSLSRNHLTRSQRSRLPFLHNQQKSLKSQRSLSVNHLKRSQRSRRSLSQSRQQRSRKSQLSLSINHLKRRLNRQLSLSISHLKRSQRSRRSLSINRLKRSQKCQLSLLQNHLKRSQKSQLSLLQNHLKRKRRNRRFPSQSRQRRI